MSIHGLAVVGTDTGVGKTAFSRGLLALARRRGLTPIPFKPVESGVGPGQPSDADLLAAAAESAQTASLFALPDPISPARAARRAGIVLDVSVIARRSAELAARGDGLLLETAGGLLSPWYGRQGAAELLIALDLPTVLVAADILGTQNHCLLTTEALTARGIRLAGIVLIGRTEGDARWENEETLAELYGASYLGRIPRLHTPTASSLADAIEKHVAWSTLLASFGRVIEPRP